MSWKKNSYFFDLQCRSFMTLNTFGTSTLTTSQKRDFFFKYVMNRTLYVYICKGGIMHFSACALSLLRFDCYTFAIDAIKVHQDSGTVGQFWTKNLEYFGHFWAFIFKKKKRVFGWCAPTILMLFSAWSKTKNIFKIASKWYP